MSHTTQKLEPTTLDSVYFLTQKIRHALDLLMGEQTPENLQRLKAAAERAMQGAEPAHHYAMSEYTRNNLARLRSNPSDDFHTLKDAFIGYVMSSQRDVGYNIAPDA
jgi:hypothetical protein